MMRRVTYDFHSGEGPARTLVVALHGCTWWSFQRRTQLRHVVDAVQTAWPHSDVLLPVMPIEFWSLRDANRVVRGVLREVDRAWNARAATGSPYDHVVLIGFSFGSVLVRRLYCLAAGARANGAVVDRGVRPWASRVERIVLLAGLNRGWTVDSPVSRIESFFNHVGTSIAHVLPRKPTLFAIRRGAPFLTQTRLQWLALRREKRLPPLTIQLLGTRDDIVSPADNIDLATGADFLYLEVPNSGHFDVVHMGAAKPFGTERRARFLLALTAPREALEREAVAGHDLLAMLPVASDTVADIDLRADTPAAPSASVDAVVFVLHGIRDKGYWTQKVARHVVATGREKGHRVLAVAPTYGYFALLPFLMPWRRRAKVEWLLDMYVAVRSRYPGVPISFIGHSNGTYILVGAIEACRAVTFHNVVFAGSVVRSSFKWAPFFKRQQVARVLNYVATADWVVAIFPRLLQRLGLRDLGGAGHDGFDGRPPVWDVEYVPGRHSAALEERHWRAIAAFVFDGDPPGREASGRRWWAVWLGHGAPLVWAVLVTIALVPIYGILVALGFPELSGSSGAKWWRESSAALPAWLWAIALMGWTRVLGVILLRL